jgi:L-asparaginase II
VQPAHLSGSSVELAHVTRGGIVESIHRGHLVLATVDGEQTWGDADLPIYPRSAVKPIQATVMVESGLDLPDPLLALSSASHAGSAMHTRGAIDILASVDLTVDALQCPADLPYGTKERVEWTREGREKERVIHNCSGKHAAMIATSALNGWSVENYRDPSHPLQLRIASRIEELAGEKIAKTTVDGCGAPLFAISTLGLARAISRLMTSAETSSTRVLNAMRTHPEMVSGFDRPTTRLMQLVPGLIVKEGAEGVQIAALPDGRTLAIKIEDGSARPIPLLTAWALRRWGISSPELDQLVAAPILGGGQPVGEVKVVLGQ